MHSNFSSGFNNYMGGFWLPFKKPKEKYATEPEI